MGPLFFGAAFFGVFLGSTSASLVVDSLISLAAVFFCAAIFLGFLDTAVLLVSASSSAFAETSSVFVSIISIFGDSIRFSSFELVVSIVVDSAFFWFCGPEDIIRFSAVFFGLMN